MVIIKNSIQEKILAAIFYKIQKCAYSTLKAQPKRRRAFVMLFDCGR
jgi:hypothetical protein